MKLLRITTIAALAAALFAGCVSEDMQVDGAGEPVVEGQGYLSLSGLAVKCVVDHQPTVEGKDESEVVPLSAATRTAKAGEEVSGMDIDAFDCFILDRSGETVLMQFKYGARPTEAIPLERGNYLFRMSSGDVPAAEWETPVYGVTEAFSILSKETTSLEMLICTLQNIQVTVSYSADLRAALSPETTTTVSVADNSLVFEMDETRSAYFAAPALSNDIDVLVKGKYKPKDKTEFADFEMTATIPAVKAGQYSDITLLVEHSVEGGIAIKTTIDGWVVDDEILCDYSVMIAETVIDESGNKPVIEWLGGDIDTPLTLAADRFDADGNYLDDVLIYVATKSTIASLVVNISSTNSELDYAFAATGISSIDMCKAGSYASLLSALGYPVNDEVLGKAEVTFNMRPQISELNKYIGTHYFALTAIDEKGNVTEKMLSLVVNGAEGGPVIAWTGYNIDERYPIEDGMTADFVISSAAGIKSFVVEIISDTLTATELRGVGLCDYLDLGNPEASKDTTDPSWNNTAAIGSALEGLGFPTGSAVLGQQQVSFSITQFLDLLKVTGAGSHDFKMIVTDNDGLTTVKTIMLLTE